MCVNKEYLSVVRGGWEATSSFFAISSVDSSLCVIYSPLFCTFAPHSKNRK
ncbi:hypothetical protein PRABACTJOHN_01818 [Parabacteroides johnsonii DSM 18315]|uniref:Uncharacterized protein n=1 Tax=Parabacteroides johnsonii DSM 18315 TaxID=537006 RepID=B7B9W3_9BACT|nr:hypothetical protein PRABACTJOHN_01818 [Parabacteroides johnsonii DSM 18315]